LSTQQNKLQEASIGETNKCAQSFENATLKQNIQACRVDAQNSGLNVCVQILRWQVERPFWKCGFYQLFITIHSARQIQSETALRMSEQKEYPTGL
jgi:hypothetical protein